MPEEFHAYFTAFSSGRKALVMFCVKKSARITISFLLRYNNTCNNNNNKIRNFVKTSFGE